jgi:hypothetical protein
VVGEFGGEDGVNIFACRVSGIEEPRLPLSSR